MNKYIFLFLLVLSGLTTTKGQTVTTVVGTGAAGHTGDGGSALSATINMPIGCYADALGNLYISDQQNHCIRKVNTSGIISTIAGTGGSAGYGGDGGPATAAHINTPGGVFVDDTGNVYFADGLNHRIRKVNTAGTIYTIAGNGTPGFGGDGTAAVTAMIDNPIGVCVDITGNIYIADQHNHRIRKVNTSGIISTIAGNGVSGYYGDGGAAISAEMSYPNYVIVDDTGNVYFTDNGNHRIRKINTSGIISTVAGNGSGGYTGDGTAATLAELYYPAGIRKDSIGNLYIADYGNNVVRKVNSLGIISTLAGTGASGYYGDGVPATTAVFNQTSDVAIGSGMIYIADYNNNRIRTVFDVNHPPHFTVSSPTLTICENAVAISIDTQLSVVDTNIGQTETWSIVVPPSHGTAAVAYATSSTGGVLIPTGLSYTPATGYVGIDAIKVSVSDGVASDETEIDFTINPLPGAGTISGIDSVCPGNLVTLTDTVSGGTWSISNNILATVSGAGVVTGITPGYDTVVYTTTNSCGVATAILPLKVRSMVSCTTETGYLSQVNETGITITPNPNTGEFVIKACTKVTEQAEFTITDVIGQKVKAFTNQTNNPININIDVPTGIYLLSVFTEHQKWSKKIIIGNR